LAFCFLFKVIYIEKQTNKQCVNERVEKEIMTRIQLTTKHKCRKKNEEHVGCCLFYMGIVCF